MGTCPTIQDTLTFKERVSSTQSVATPSISVASIEPRVRIITGHHQRGHTDRVPGDHCHVTGTYTSQPKQKKSQNDILNTERETRRDNAHSPSTRAEN